MQAIDRFLNSAIGRESGAIELRTITPSNTEDQPYVVRQIYVGVGGDVALMDTMGNSTVHKNVASGQYLGPFNIARVLVTGTTATDMVGYV